MNTRKVVAWGGFAAMWILMIVLGNHDHTTTTSTTHTTTSTVSSSSDPSTLSGQYRMGAAIVTYEGQCGPIGPNVRAISTLLNQLPVDHPMILEAEASIVREYQTVGSANWCSTYRAVMEK